MSKFCIACGAPIQLGDKFCKSCGKEQQVVITKIYCNKCGYASNGKQRFCKQCGYQLIKDQKTNEKVKPIIVQKPVKEPSQESDFQSEIIKIKQVKNTVKKAINLIEKSYKASPKIGEMFFDE